MPPATPRSAYGTGSDAGDPAQLPADSALLVADTVAELKVAADSAADEAVLEELAEAHPERTKRR